MNLIWGTKISQKCTSRLESLDAWSATKAISALRNYKIRRHHTKIIRPVDLEQRIFPPQIYIFNFTKTQNFWFDVRSVITVYLHEPG